MATITNFDQVIIDDGLQLTNSVPSTTTNKLYNDGGTLTFNGSAIGGGSSYTAGSGLTLVGTEFNTAGTGNFEEISFPQSVLIGKDVQANGSLHAGDILRNVAIGYQAGSGAINTRAVTALGYHSNTLGIGNIYSINIGDRSGYNSKDNTYTTSIGQDSLASSSGCDRTVAIGGYTGNSAETFSDSIAIGHYAGLVANGNQNVYIGSSAGQECTGSNNIEIIGDSFASNNYAVLLGQTTSNKINIQKTIIGDTSSKLLAIGNVGSSDLTPDATLEIKPNATTDVGLIVQAVASHSASLQEWQNSSETKLLAVGPDGGLELPNNVPSTTTNKLYNNGGTLTFNGSAVNTDTDTTYTAGSGLSLVGTEFNVYGGSGQFREILIDDNFPITIKSEGNSFSSYGPDIRIGYAVAEGITSSTPSEDGNVIIGDFAASGATGNNRAVIIGRRAARNSVIGYSSILLGQEAGYSAASAQSQLIGVGISALGSTSGCSILTAIGTNAGASSTSSSWCNFIGHSAGNSSQSLTYSNTFGRYAGQHHKAGSHNNYFGDQAGFVSSGNYNIGIGRNGFLFAAGSNNIEIVTNGNSSASIIGTNDNKIHIENTIIGDTSSKLLAIGNVTSSDLTPDATLEIKPNATTDIGLIVQAVASHSASLQEWQNSSETKLLAVGPDGGLEIPSNTPSTTTNKLYNDGSNLNFGTKVIIDSTNVNTGLQYQPLAGGLNVTGLTTTEFAAATLVTAAEGIGSNNNDTTIPTSAAVKAYADSVAVSPGGSDTQIQFNDGGSFGGDADLVWNKTTNALTITGSLNATTKSFLIDHPSKPGMKLQYASLEGPENGVYVRGTTDSGTITLPDYWRDLVHNGSITVTLTPVGQFQPLFVEQKSNREIRVGGVCGYYDYVVYGERKDVDKLEVEW